MDLFEEILYLAGCYEERIDENVGGIKKRNAPSMSPEEFRQVISYDPILYQYLDLDDRELSNKPNSYLLWLVVHWNDVKNNSAENIKTLLNDFKVLCGRNKITNKDINSYKSVKDLIDEVEEAKNKKDSLSQKQHQARRESHYADKDIKLLCSGDIFDMYQPLSYSASVKLGKNTKWCTATNSNDENYKKYINYGPLYIFINKKNPNEKYQLWFYNKNNTNFYSDDFPDFDNDIYLFDQNNDTELTLEVLLADKKIYDYLHNTPSITQYLEKYCGKEMEKDYNDIKDYDSTSFESICKIRNIKYENKNNYIYVDSDLFLSKTHIKNLPNNLYVNGDLDLERTIISDLPLNLKVIGNIWLDNSNIINLSDNLYVGRDLSMFFCKNIKKLPNNLHVLGAIHLTGSNIETISNDLSVGGDLDLADTKIKQLPDNLKVGGSLNLRETQITHLPNNLKIGEKLILIETQITHLPDNLKVGGYIRVDGNKVKEMKRLNPKFADKITD